MKFIKLILLIFLTFYKNILPVVVVTCSDEIYFDHAINLIGSIHKNNSDVKILLYDLGLTKDQLNFLQNIENVEIEQVEKANDDILKFVRIDVHGKVARGWYAFKPVIIKQALDRFETILYLDAGNTVLGDLSKLYAYIEQNGYFFIDGFHNICDWITKDARNFTINLAKEKASSILDSNTKSISANIIGLSKKYYDSVVLPMYKHAKELILFKDDGSSNNGFGKHRHDQSLFSIYVRNLDLKTFEQGNITLNLKDQKYTFNTHFEEHCLNDKSLIYQSRWNIKYDQINKPYYEQFIRFKNNSKKPKNEFNKTDLIVFSYDRPMQLFALLESCQKYIKGLDNISLIYRCSNARFEDAYKVCFDSFKNLKLNPIKQNHHDPTNNFKNLIINTIRFSKNKFVMFAVDDIIVKNYVNLNECIRYLRKTDAYGFYLRLGKNISQCYTESIETPMPKCHHIKKDVYKTNFDGKGDWNYPCTLDMALYKKSKILESIYRIHFNTPNRFEGNWHVNEWHNNQKKDKAGLFYENSKIVNIPLNMVQTDGQSKNLGISTELLLEKFESGLKIDIEPLFKIENKAPHMEYNFNFISRNNLDFDELRSALRSLDINKLQILSKKQEYYLKLKQTDIYNVKDENGYTPLMWACNFQLADVVKFLIENKADVNATDKNNFTALMYACWRGNYDIVKILLESKADKDIIDINGTTALTITSSTDNKEQDKIIQCLLEH